VGVGPAPQRVVPQHERRRERVGGGGRQRLGDLAVDPQLHLRQEAGVAV